MVETQEYRTIMYSIRKTEEGEEVVVHRLPWNANEKYGMQKLQKMLDRGFTFKDPRKGNGGVPEVLVTDTVNLEKPIVDFKPPESMEEFVDRSISKVPQWGYFCTKCDKVHNEKSNIGKRHLKHKKEG